MAKNPGKNVKGQKCRANKHFTGTIPTSYVENNKKRTETKSKRMKTIKQKLHDVSSKTGVQILMQWKDEEGGPVHTFKTTNCSIGQVPTTSQENSHVVNMAVETNQVYPDPPVTNSDTNAEDNCKICNNSHIGKRKRCKWINCIEKKCEWWVHALCAGLTGDSEELKSLKYMCPEHIEKLINKKK